MAQKKRELLGEKGKSYEIRPIIKDTWHGKVGKESFTCEKVIQAAVDIEAYEYKVKITQKEIDELKDGGLRYDLSLDFDAEVPHPFWDTTPASVKLTNKTEFKTIKKPLDLIHYRIILASKHVANSQKELDEGKWPFASHILYDKEAEVAAKASKLAIKKKARKLADAASLTEKIQVLMLLEETNHRNSSADAIDVAMDEIVETKAVDIINILSGDKEYNSARHLILECLQRQILRKSGTNIIYFDTTIGTDIQQAANFLKENDNQQLRLKLIEKVNEK